MYSVSLKVSDENGKSILYIGLQGKNVSALKQRMWRTLGKELEKRRIDRTTVHLDMQVEKDGEWIDSDEGAIE